MANPPVKIRLRHPHSDQTGAHSNNAVQNYPEKVNLSITAPCGIWKGSVQL